MIFLLGAAGTALSALQSIQEIATSKAPAADAGQASPFAQLAAGATDASSPATAVTPASSLPSGRMSTDTMRSLLDIQSQASGGAGTSQASGRSRLLKALDSDGDGQVSRSELAAAFGQGDDTSASDALFDTLDTNRDDAITAGELPAIRHKRRPHQHGSVAAADASILPGVSSSEQSGGIAKTVRAA